MQARGTFDFNLQFDVGHAFAVEARDDFIDARVFCSRCAQELLLEGCLDGAGLAHDGSGVGERGTFEYMPEALDAVVRHAPEFEGHALGQRQSAGFKPGRDFFRFADCLDVLAEKVVGPPHKVDGEQGGVGGDIDVA